MRSYRYTAAALAALTALTVGCSTDRGGELLAPLLFTSPGDATAQRYGEPNDTMDEANDIAANNVPVASAFHRLGDVDYYRFLAASGAQYIVETGDIEDGVKTRIEIRDTQDSVLAADAGSGLEPGASRILWNAPSSGWYFVRVTPLPGSLVGTYSIRISVGSDMYEPDNSIFDAKIIGIDGVAQQHTFPTIDDVDYVSFAGWANFIYRVDVAAAETQASGGFDVTLYDQSGAQVSAEPVITAAAPGMTTSQDVFLLPHDGRYYVKIAPGSSLSLGTYTVSVAPASDPYEPDNTISDAKPIATDGTAQRHAFPNITDQDYVSFNADSGAIYTIRTDSLTNGVDTQIEIDSGAGTPLISNDNGGGGKASELLWTAPASETFYVRIMSTATGKPGEYLVSVTKQ